MEIKINKKILENAISIMQPFLEKKDMSQVISHIYLEATSSKLIVKATDYEIGLEATIENLTLTTAGKATANGKKILDIIKRLKDDDITLKTTETDLLISQNKSNFKLPMFDYSEFPQFPTFNESTPKISINALELINSLKKITPSIDNNNPKIELNGALIDIKEERINFVSTDTKRLSVIDITNNGNSPMEIIIPKKGIIEIQKLFSEEVEIYYNSINLIIKTKNLQFFTKLINGKFPDYQRIIPKSIKNKFILPKDKFVESLNIINSVSNDVKLKFSKSGILFESLSDENSEAKTVLDIELDLEAFQISINSKHVLDFLSVCEGNEFEMGINDQNLPFILKNNKLQKILMPVI